MMRIELSSWYTERLDTTSSCLIIYLCSYRANILIVGSSYTVVGFIQGNKRVATFHEHIVWCVYVILCAFFV